MLNLWGPEKGIHGRIRAGLYVKDVEFGGEGQRAKLKSGEIERNVRVAAMAKAERGTTIVGIVRMISTWNGGALLQVR